MGTTLTGTTPQDTYDSLIKVTDNGPLSGTAKYLSDGLGNDSGLALSTGNVGIGTTSPAEKLSVAGAIITTGGITGHGANRVSVSQEGANGAFIQSYGANTSTVGAFTFRQASSDFSVTQIPLAITAAGNVGIGTSSPTEKLHVVSSSDVTVRLQRTGVRELNLSSAGITATSEFLYLSSDYGALSAIPLIVNGAERVRVTTNGLTFNGDTAAANALDDYEEGTWTMGVSFGGGTTGQTNDSNTGTYTKIGRQVTVNGFFRFTNKGTSTGAAVITGLPFTIASANLHYSAASLAFFNVSFANQYQGYGQVFSTNIFLEEITEAGAATVLTDADFANNSSLMVSLTYFV